MNKFDVFPYSLYIMLLLSVVKLWHYLKAKSSVWVAYIKQGRTHSFGSKIQVIEQIVENICSGRPLLA